MSEVTPMNQETTKRKWHLAPLDYMAIIAGIINLVVIGYIVINYWFINN